MDERKDEMRLRGKQSSESEGERSEVRLGRSFRQQKRDQARNHLREVLLGEERRRRRRPRRR